MSSYRLVLLKHHNILTCVNITLQGKRNEHNINTNKHCLIVAKIQNQFLKMGDLLGLYA